MNPSSQCTILIVDDTEENVDILLSTLGEFYDISVAIDGESALEILENTTPDLILLDIMMPGISGYEVCEWLKRETRTLKIPVIFLTALGEAESEEYGLSLGAVDYITKPFNPSLVKARVKNHLELKMHRDNLEMLVQQRTSELELTQEVTIESMGSLAEYRDPETGGHIQRTKYYIEALAQELSKNPKYHEILDQEVIKALRKSAPLHDIGKVGVPDHILLKPEKLTITLLKEGNPAGWEIDEMPDALKELYGVEKGVIVKELEKNGSAEKQGFKAFDLIISADGKTVENKDDVNKIMDGKKSGEKTTFSVIRLKNEQISSSVVIGIK